MNTNFYTFLGLEVAAAFLGSALMAYGYKMVAAIRIGRGAVPRQSLPCLRIHPGHNHSHG